MSTWGILSSRLYRSFQHGFRGFTYLLKEKNYQIGVIITIGGVIFFYIVDRSFIPLFVLMSTVVLISEGTNTAIELLCDFVYDGYHPTIGKIKDMAAANTVIAVLVSAMVGLGEFIKLWGLMVGVVLWIVIVGLLFLIFSLWR